MTMGSRRRFNWKPWLIGSALLGCANSPDYALYDLVEPAMGGMGGVPDEPQRSDGGTGAAAGGSAPGVTGGASGTGGAVTGGIGGSVATGGSGGQYSTGGVSSGGNGTGGEPADPDPSWSWSRDFDGLWNAPGELSPVPHYGFIQLSFRVECQGDTYHYAGVSSAELPSGYSGEVEFEPTSEGQRAIMNCASPRAIQLLVRRRIRVTSSGVDTTESTQAAMAISPDLSIQRIRLVVEDLSWFAPDGETTGVYLIERYRWEAFDE